MVNAKNPRSSQGFAAFSEIVETNCRKSQVGQCFGKLHPCEVDINDFYVVGAHHEIANHVADLFLDNKDLWSIIFNVTSA